MQIHNSAVVVPELQPACRHDHGPFASISERSTLRTSGCRAYLLRRGKVVRLAEVSHRGGGPVAPGAHGKARAEPPCRALTLADLGRDLVVAVDHHHPAHAGQSAGRL